MSPAALTEGPGPYHFNVRADGEHGRPVYECTCTIDGVSDPAAAAGEAIKFASGRLKDAGYVNYPVWRWVVTVFRTVDIVP